MNTAYLNAVIHTGEENLHDHIVLVSDGAVQDIVTSEVSEEYEHIDCKGLHLAPAFVDLQLYGGNGRLFSAAPSTEAIASTYQYCLEGGCAHFMITMATNTIAKFLEGIKQVRAYWQQGGKGLLGLHLEGPYINPSKRGAHLLDCIRQPSVAEVEMLLREGSDVIKMVTLAPELCEPQIVEMLLENNILVSAGHTNASYAEAMDAFNRGIPLATHLYNAMSPLLHREPGMVGAILDHEKISASLVCDGIHVDYAAVRIAKKIMGSRLFYITDAVTEVLSGEYHHLFKGDRYTLPDGTLSGSALKMIDCVRNGCERAGIDLDESLRMAGMYPAAFLKDRKLGRIAHGYEAAFVLFDDNWKVQQVFV